MITTGLVRKKALPFFFFFFALLSVLTRVLTLAKTVQFLLFFVYIGYEKLLAQTK